MKNAQRKGSGAIRLSIPAKVAYNADAFQKSIHDLLDEIGCPKCFSGVDCYFSTVRDYVMDPTIRMAAGDPTPQPSKLAAQSTLSVGVSSNVSFDIGKIDDAIKNIFDEIGCRACCSGHDIYFQNNFDFNF